MVSAVSVTILIFSIVLYIIAAIKSKMMEPIYLLIFFLTLFAIWIVVARFITLSSMGAM